MSLGRSVSAASMLGPTKVVRRVDRPRPLKLSAANRLSALELSSVEDVVVLMENVCRHLNARNYERQVINGLLNLCNTLKRSGPQIENLYKDQLDKLGVALRNACRDDELDLVSRVHVLEIIELRAMNWQPNENVTAFYKNKLSQLEYQHLDQIPPATPGGIDSPGMISCQTAPVMLNPAAPDFSPFSTSSSSSGLNNAPMLSPGEVVGTSGRFSQPTKIPGKNYFKDEVVIRNADSGKVMGLKGRRVHMIEELTETIISFQRVVPGARERLVQITGPALENILQAKSLIEDTIRRNQSPLPREEIEEEVESLCAAQELSDSKRNTLVAEREVPFHDYKYTVNVGEDCIRVTGANLDLVRTAKLVLDEYFSLTGEGTAGQQAQTPVQSQTPGLDQGRQRPVFTLGPRSNPSPVQPSPKTAFSPVSEIQRSGSLTERSGSLTFGSGKRNSLFSKPGAISPALGKSSSKSFSKPEISYDRAELLSMSKSKQSQEAPPSLLQQLDEINHIVRRSGAPHLDGADHLSKGLSIFAVEHYIKPYNMESFED